MRVLQICASATLLALASGCTDRDGLIEVHWQFDDANLQRIYPLGFEPDTCELPSMPPAEGEVGIHYDLRVRLTVAFNTEACATDWSNPDCQVIEPMLFPCNRSRDTALTVPPSADDSGEDPGYLMVVEALVDPTDAEPFVPNPTCIAAPGPRVRRVRPGRITDLEVYEFIVLAIKHDDSLLLDIDGCRP